MIKDKEIWKPIIGFRKVRDWMYEVSNYGNIRLHTAIECKDIPLRIKDIKGHKYYIVSLTTYDGPRERYLVHQIVAKFFCDPTNIYDPENDRNIVPDHLDNNGLNNYYKNLELKTRGENISSAFKKGFINTRGERHTDALITDEQAHQICKYLMDGKSYDEIVKLMNFPNTIQHRRLLIRIKSGNAYRNVVENYDLKKLPPQYSKSCKENIDKIPMIKNLINLGYDNPNIVVEIWGKQ